jgi:hypothetical protein
MTITQTTSLTSEHKEAIRELWNQEYPQQLNYKNLSEFENYLNGLNDPNHYLGTNDDALIEAWAITFSRENEKWFAIILDQKIHGQGKGTLLLEKMKTNEQTLNGWVIDHENDRKQDGTPYKSPLGFYERNDFVICGATRMENEKISAVKIVWKQG